MGSGFQCFGLRVFGFGILAVRSSWFVISRFGLFGLGRGDVFNFDSGLLLLAVGHVRD